MVGGVNMTLFFSILVLLSSLSLIISVVLQEGSEDGLGTISGGSGSLFGKTKGQSKGELLKKVTVVSSIVFLISTLFLAAK